MLGQKIQFKGFDHATKTINEIRNQGIMRNKIKEKLQIEKLAASLDR
jgi:hypothetical protein